MKLVEFYAVALMGAGAHSVLILLFSFDHSPALHLGGAVGLPIGAVILYLSERKSRASDGRAGSGSGRRDPDSDQ